MLKKKIVLSILLGAIVMLITVICGSLLFTRAFNQGTVSIISMLIFYSFFLPGGFISGYLIKKKGFVMGIITSSVLIFSFILIAQIYNMIFEGNNVSFKSPSQSVFFYIWGQLLEFLRFIPGILIASGIGGFLGEKVSLVKTSY